MLCFSTREGAVSTRWHHANGTVLIHTSSAVTVLPSVSVWIISFSHIQPHRMFHISGSARYNFSPSSRIAVTSQTETSETSTFHNDACKCTCIFSFHEFMKFCGSRTSLWLMVRCSRPYKDRSTRPHLASACVAAHKLERYMRSINKLTPAFFLSFFCIWYVGVSFIPGFAAWAAIWTREAIDCIAEQSNWLGSWQNAWAQGCSHWPWEC